MSLQSEAINHARTIRERLRNPGNGVVDAGIDLKRPKPLPPPTQIDPPEEPFIEAGSAAEIRSVTERIGVLNAELADLYARYQILAGRQRPTIKTVQAAVAQHYKVTLVDMVSQRRDANIITVRHIAMYLAKTLTLRSLPEIGRHFGGRDHTTVLHAVRKIERLKQQDVALAVTLAEISVPFGELRPVSPITEDAPCSSIATAA